MNWKFWQNMKYPSWLPKSDAALRLENKQLKELAVYYNNIAKSLDMTLRYNAIESHKMLQAMREQAMALLGGIALQHQGEVLIKDEFLKMVENPEFRLKVVVERNPEDNGTFVRTVEEPHPDQKEQTADVESKE